MERHLTDRLLLRLAACIAAQLIATVLAFAEPGSLAPATPEVDRAPALAAPPLQKQATTPTGRLRRLSSHIEGFRLSGETATTEWPVYLTDAQASEKLRFRLGYLTAISVAPELSTLKIEVNDVQIGAAPVAATPDVRALEFDVPASLLQTGYNAVRITADQRHRVDCSIGATYELWTQIDPAQTGFVMPEEDAGPANLAELAALSPDERGAMPIRVVIGDHSSKTDIERVIRAVQTISLAGHFVEPLVDFGPPANGPYGVNLVIGTSAEALAQLDGSETKANGPRAVLHAAQADRRATLVITGTTEAEVDLALAQIPTATMIKGSPGGLRAAASFRGYPMMGGSRVQLNEMGVASQEFGGRLFHTSFNIAMPADFYPADYGKAVLDLAGGYAAGLTQDAQILVSVNGRDTTSIRLPKIGGDVYDHNPLPLPLGSLRPGLNRIEVKAQLPTPGDATCAGQKASAEPARFLLLGSSQLETPSIARVARSPDLAVSATGGFPFGAGAKPAILVVPAPEKNALGAAATIAAQFAIAAGRAIDFRVETSMPSPGAGATLVVGAFNDLDASVLSAMGIPKDTLDAAWRDAAAPSSHGAPETPISQRERTTRNRFALQRNLPASCQTERPVEIFARRTTGIDRTAVGAIKPSEDDSAGRSLRTEWSDRTAGRFALEARAFRAFDDARDWVEGRYAAAADFVANGFSKAPEPAFVSRRSSLAIAQANFGASPDDVVTLVTAANASALFDSTACLVDPSVWRNIAGRASALDTSDGSISSLAPERTTFIVTQPLGVANARLIAAGWLSLNTDVYVGAALAVVLALAVCTLWFVRNAGRRVE
jgi:cellulose synthase operon protein B